MHREVDLSLARRLKIEVTPSARSTSDFATDVLDGLSAKPKRLSCKYFYDERGSELFEDICNLPEYYLTRTEQAILELFAPEMARYSNGNMTLVELGSGSSRKTRLLIEALLAAQGSLHYLPVDISESMMVEVAKELIEEYADLHITAYVAEYNEGLRKIAEEGLGQKMVVFLGSNIGNFDFHETVDFLRNVRRQLSSDDVVLLGADMQKDLSVLEAAYNDSKNVTAEFNLNLLRRVNRDLGGEFDLNSFSHVALYNVRECRIEMYLRSERDQEVHIRELDKTFYFKDGETIHTENSYKYSKEQIVELCSQSGFDVARSWEDEKGYFSLNLLTPA